MRHWQRSSPTPRLRVFASRERSQAATMVRGVDETVGGPANVDESADQWLYVLAGEGQAVVGDQPVPPGSGSFLLVEAGEPRGIRDRGDGELETLNLEAPPQY